MLLTLRSSALHTCFVSRDPMSISFSETPYPRYHAEVLDSTREEARVWGGERKKKAIKNASGSFDRDRKLYSVNRAVQCGTLGPYSELCSEPFHHVPETVELATSSRSFATFARPSAVSTLACEERYDAVCVVMCLCVGKAEWVWLKVALVTLYFLTVRMDIGPIQTNK